jgi:hypothetical protein
MNKEVKPTIEKGKESRSVIPPTMGRFVVELLWRPTAAASIGASLFASAGATVAANQESPQPHSNVGIHLDIGAGFQDVDPVSGYTEFPGVRVDVSKTTGKWSEVTIPGEPGETIQQSIARYYTQLMEYAEEYSASPESENPNGPEDGVQNAVLAIEDLVSQGYSIDQIIVLGQASDENISTMPEGSSNPGFNVPEPKNVELAEKRGGVVYDLMVEQARIQGLDIDNIPFTVSGEEVEDPVLAERIEEIAARRGITALQLVRAYNDEDTSLGLTPSEEVVIRGLEQYRSVKIMIIASETIVIPGSGPETHRKLEKESDTNSLVFVPVIVPIPLLRRRESIDEPDDNRIIIDFSPPPPPPPIGNPWYVEKIKIRKGKDERLSGAVGKVAFHRKQPGQHNNGKNRGTRGQRSSYKVSAHRYRSGRSGRKYR